MIVLQAPVASLELHFKQFMPPPHMVGELCEDDRCLSVRPSVCCPVSRMEGRRMLNIGRMEGQITGDP